jgi:hypothetical protein
MAAVLSGMGLAARAQRPDPFFNQTQFAQWAGSGPQEEVPWKVHAQSTGLSVYQRLSALVVAEIEGRYLKQRPTSGDLVAQLQLIDHDGRVYRDHSILTIDPRRPDVSNGAYFAWSLFMLPGEYDLVLTLVDKVTGKRNYAHRNLHIDRLNKDPLPEAWRDLPAVEFLRVENPPDSYFHPDSWSRLRLPLTSQHPVRIEVLANLTGTGRAMVSHRAYNFNLTSLLPILKTFSQMEVQNGVLNFEVLDLVRRQVSFEQDNAHNLDWPRLKEAVTRADPTKIDVRALQDVKHTASFMRQEVARRLGDGKDNQEATPVLVVISSAAFFDSFDDINDTLLPKECNCAIYYIRYSPVGMRRRLSPVEFDNVKKVLKPLPVRRHYAETPEDLRRIMAEIIQDVSKM